MNNWDETISHFFNGAMLLKRCYEHFLDPLARKAGLPRIEVEILLFLANHPNQNTAKDIVSKKHFTKSHISTALKHLESIGYVRRYFDQDNRKTIYLSLEPASYPLVHQGILAQRRYAEALVHGISEDKIHFVYDLLNQVYANACRELNIEFDDSLLTENSSKDCS